MRLVSARWLVATAYGCGECRIRRRQELPPEAFLTYDQLTALPVPHSL